MTQAAPPPAGPKNQPLAIWSLILGIASLVMCCLIFTGIPAIILGGMAKKKIAESGGTFCGEGLAKIGVILGWVSVALTVLCVILGIIFASYLGEILPRLD